MSWASSPARAARPAYRVPAKQRPTAHRARRRLFIQHSGTTFYSALPLIAPYPDFLSDYRSYVFGDETAQSLSAPEFAETAATWRLAA